MQENQVPQKKSSWLKQETSFLECSEQGRELQTFRVQWLLWNTVALEGHGKSLVWYFLCKIILECTEKLSPFLSCQIETLGQSCCPVPSFLQGCCPSTAGMGLCGQAAAAVHCWPCWLQAGHFPTHTDKHQGLHIQGGICKSSHCWTASAAFEIGPHTFHLLSWANGESFENSILWVWETW